MLGTGHGGYWRRRMAQCTSFSLLLKTCSAKGQSSLSCWMEDAGNPQRDTHHHNPSRTSMSSKSDSGHGEGMESKGKKLMRTR